MLFVKQALRKASAPFYTFDRLDGGNAAKPQERHPDMALPMFSTLLAVTSGFFHFFKKKAEPLIEDRGQFKVKVF